MKAILAAAIALGILAAPAQGHSTIWYWSEHLAEIELLDRYDAMYEANCYGFGRMMRVKSAKRGYKHFRCNVTWDDGDNDGGVLHVTGKYRLSFKWG